MASFGNASGDSEFGAAIKAGRWPPHPQAFRDIAAVHHAVADALEAAGDISKGGCRPEFAEALVGLAGDALLATHDRNVIGENGWFDHSDGHRAAGNAANDVADYQDGLRNDLNNVIAVGEPAYNAAKKRGDVAGADEILDTHLGWADSAVAHAQGRITDAVNRANEKFKAIPLDSLHDNRTNNPDHRSDTAPAPPGTNPKHRSDSAPPPADPDNTTSEPPPGPNPKHRSDSAPPPAGPDSTTSDPPPGRNPNHRSDTPLPGYPSGPTFPPFPSVPFSPAAGGGGRGVGGGGGLGGGGRGVGSMPISPAAFGGGLGEGVHAPSVPTSPAASPTPLQQFSAPLAHAGSGFESGLASGMGSSGAVPPAGFEHAVQQPYVQQAVPIAAGPGAGGLGTPAAAGGGAGVAAFGDAPVAHAGDAGAPAGGPMFGGGAMMPPPAMAGGAVPPPAPYSAPGAGSAPSPPSVPTSPASSESSGGGPASASPGVGAGSVFAGPSGAVAGAGASSTEAGNPDLAAAQQILAALVKACPPSRAIFWAVSILRTPVGPQTVIANSVGGGTYLPSGVRLPSTMRLATLDPALPFGWAGPWMGWQAPSAILVDHFERLQTAMRGVAVSAIATSELWPHHPDCGGDFVGIRHEELLRSAAAPLTGSHRLAVTDPALAARLAALDRGGDMTNWVGSMLTGGVMHAAIRPDATGSAVAVHEDARILDLVAHHRATAEEWRAYNQLAEQRDDGAVLYAPRDADDSPSTLNSRMWYQHYYASARIAEMVTCWEVQPVSLGDIAYCGIAAGFGAVVAAVVAEIEKRLGEM